MIDIDGAMLVDLYNNAQVTPGNGSTPGGAFSTANIETAISEVTARALRSTIQAVSATIPGFETSAIHLSTDQPGVQYDIVIEDIALRRKSLYNNSKLHAAAYATGLQDIVALKHFGSGGRPRGRKRRGYWETHSVWIAPRPTRRSPFLRNLIRDINTDIKRSGLPGIAMLGERYQ